MFICFAYIPLYSLTNNQYQNKTGQIKEDFHSIGIYHKPNID